MEIVICNDDGWGMNGIRTLAEEMIKIGHVTIVAPDGARSGHGTCISTSKPLYLTKQEAESNHQIDVYTCNGTPADCAKLAIEVLFAERKIDLLVSGINHGSNASINLLYSGTMGACIIATEHHIPAIGFSLDDMSPDADMSKLKAWLVDITNHLIEEGWKPNLCYNVNAPKGDIKGLRWCRQSMGHWEKEYEPHTDEQGKTYYTLTGYYVNDEVGDDSTDIWALENGYISIQPISIDMTDYGSL